MSQRTTLSIEYESQPVDHHLDSLPLQGLGIAVLAGGICWGLLKRKYSRTSENTKNIAVQNPGVLETDTLETQTLTQLGQTFTQSLQWLGYGKSLEKEKRYADAIAVYDWALKLYPREYKLWHERGLALAKSRRFEEAIESYDQAHQLRPQQRDLAHERGDALLELERYEEAIESFDTFLRYAPNNAHVLGDRGYALHQLGQYSEALQTLNQAMKHSQRDRSSAIHAHYYQISTLCQLEQLQVALESTQSAIQRYPQDQNFETLHSQIQEALGQRNKS